MEAIKNSNYFGNNFWLGFDIKQIIDSLLFLFLLTHTRLNSNEKVHE